MKNMQEKLEYNSNSPTGTRKCNYTRNVGLRDIGLQLMQQTSPILIILNHKQFEEGEREQVWFDG